MLIETPSPKRFCAIFGLMTFFMVTTQAYPVGQSYEVYAQSATSEPPAPEPRVPLFQAYRVCVTLLSKALRAAERAKEYQNQIETRDNLERCKKLVDARSPLPPWAPDVIRAHDTAWRCLDQNYRAAYNNINWVMYKAESGQLFGEDAEKAEAAIGEIDRCEQELSRALAEKRQPLPVNSPLWDTGTFGYGWEAPGSHLTWTAPDGTTWRFPGQINVIDPRSGEISQLVFQRGTAHLETKPYAIAVADYKPTAGYGSEALFPIYGRKQ